MAKRFVLGQSSARKFRELINEGEGVSSRDLIGGAKFAVSRVDPFTVQWAASVNSGEYLIYLATPKKLLYVNGEWVDLAKDLENADGDYPKEWYILPPAAGAGSVYLHVYTKKGEDDPCACDCSCGEAKVRVEFGDENAHPHSDENAISILIAKTARDSASGRVTITQIVKSAILLGGSGAAGDTFDKGWYSTYKDVDGWHFKDCFYRVGNEIYHGSDEFVVDRPGCWCLCISQNLHSHNEVRFFKDIMEAAGVIGGEYIVPLFVFEADDDFCEMCTPNRIHPVLDCRLGPYVGGIGSEDHGCFALAGENLVNCYYWNGSQLKKVDGIGIDDGANSKFLVLRIDSAGDAQFEFYSSIDTLNFSAASQDVVIIPLYKFGPHHEVEVDLRGMPRGDSWAVIA